MFDFEDDKGWGLVLCLVEFGIYSLLTFVKLECINVLDIDMGEAGESI